MVSTALGGKIHGDWPPAPLTSPFPPSLAHKANAKGGIAASRLLGQHTTIRIFYSDGFVVG